MMKPKLSQGLPEPGECTYNGRFGNFCHRPGIPEQGGLCYWHSQLPKTRESFIEEYQSGGSFEGVVIARLDLSGMSFPRIGLRGFTAYQCSFDRTDFSYAYMPMSVFEGCNFFEANLQHANAELARLTRCIFYKANLNGTDLLSADLSNSCFDLADLQGIRIGLAPIILAPGTGNPDQHYTRIEGTSFREADLRGVDIDQRYKNAPNLQEPLRKVWLSEVQQQLDLAIKAQTNDEKKKTLELLVQSVIAFIPGLKVYSSDKRRLTDEIDIIVMNQCSILLTAGLGGPILVECKNAGESKSKRARKTTIGSGVVAKLAGKIPQGGIGVLVTTASLSKDAEKEMRIQMMLNAARGLRLAFWDRTDLERIAKGTDKPEDRLIDRYYYILNL